jgi:RNA polymerase sigma-70 factor (ECF subfamily)
VYVVMHEAPAMAGLDSDIRGAADGWEASDAWLRRFHDGEPDAIEQVYREHFDTVGRVVAPLLGRGDGETVIQEIFFRLITQPALRAAFRGGDLGSWLCVVSRNHAIDYLRRRNREVPTATVPAPDQPGSLPSWETEAEARLLVERFRAEVLPPKWAATFELRFLQQLSQSEAAAALGMGRTTLAYQEARVRRLLRKFLLVRGRKP